MPAAPPVACSEFATSPVCSPVCARLRLSLGPGWTTLFIEFALTPRPRSVYLVRFYHYRVCARTQTKFPLSVCEGVDFGSCSNTLSTVSNKTVPMFAHLAFMVPYLHEYSSESHDPSFTGKPCISSFRGHTHDVITIGICRDMLVALGRQH